MKEKHTNTALITGGAGFLGSHLTDLLIEKGWNVRVIDNLSNGDLKNLFKHNNSPQFSFEEIDILDLKSNNSIFRDLDYVFHLAGKEDAPKSFKSPEDYFKINVQGTVNVLQASRQSNLKKFLYACSASIYGHASVPTLESDALMPLSPAALSKLQGEQSVFHWSFLYNIPSVSLRLFSCYGPRCYSKQNFGNVFGVWMKQKLQELPLTLEGNGEQTRDFIYCLDVANAFFTLALEGKNTEAYNIGSGKPRSLNELAQLLKNKTQPISKRTHNPDKMWADLSKVQYDTNWSPKFDLESGIEQSLKVINNWESAPLWTEDEIKDIFNNWSINLIP